MKIILADDHPLIRESLSDYISAKVPDSKIIQTASLGETEQVLASISGDLVILDLNMPGMNGVAGLRGIVDRYPDQKVMIISGSVSEDDVQQALNVGAKAYLPKTMPPDEMLEKILVVADGGTYDPLTSDDVYISVNNECLERDDAQNKLSPIFAGLTKREREVLNGVVNGKSNKEIARDLNLTEVTVKVHLRGVFAKFNVSKRTQAATLALEYGWVKNN